MFGFSSKSQFPLRWRGGSAPLSSRIRWSGCLISAFVLTTGSFRARTRCRSAASATSLRCRSREQLAVMRTVFLSIVPSRPTPTNGDTLLAFNACREIVSIALLSTQVPEAEYSASGSHWKKERTSHGFEFLLDVARCRSSQERYPPRFAWFSPIRFMCLDPNCRPASLPDLFGWQRSRIQNSTPLKLCAYRHTIRLELSHVPN